MNQSNLFGNVNSIETMGLVDGPGIRVVVFMQGCNLRCMYCHNPETWCNDIKNKMSVEEVVSITKGHNVKIDEVVSKVLKYKNYISKNGGVTFSGGEPLLQSEFIYECIKRLKEENIHICIDTSGVGYDYEKLIDFVDLFIIDVKSTFTNKYKLITGKDMDEFSKFMKLIKNKNKKIWIRQVIVPTINDNEENILHLASYINSLENVEKVELLPYHTLGKNKYDKLNIKYRLDGIEDMSKTKLEYLQKMLNKNLKNSC